MNTRFRLQEKDIYRLVHTAVIICIALFCLGSFFGVHSLTPLHFLAAFGILALFISITLLSMRGRFLCLSSLAILLLVAVLTVGAETSLSFLRSYIWWLLGRNGYTADWIMGYELVQTLLISAICYLLQMFLEKYLFLKGILAGALFGGLLYCLFSQTSLPHAGVVFIICYIVMTGMEGIELYWKKIRSRDIKAYMLWLAPFLALYFLLMLLTPAPKKPYDWQFVKVAYHQLRESFLSLTQNLFKGNKEDFDSSLSGFSEDGILGGDLAIDDREIMVIQSEDRLMTNIYLPGKIFDTFDGRQWFSENRDTEPERFLDTAETLYAIRRYSGSYPWDYIYKTTLSIRYQYYNTSILFAPLKTEYVHPTSRNLDFTNDGGSLVFSASKGYGTEYEVSYYQLNLDQEAFYQLLETVQAPDESALKTVLLETERASGNRFTLEDLEARPQKIREDYLGEVDLSEEVQAYLSEITKDTHSDIEKLRLIERELASFSYTWTPGSLPDTVTDAGSFLDYFLLESRQGYCTYFATAFTLLARAEGFPARYVQGFCVPINKEGETTVYSYMAHAWPEVYIDGAGWIPFEPTPGYGQIRYTPWEMEQKDIAFSSNLGTQYQTGPPENTEETAPKPQEEPEETKRELSVFVRLSAYAILGILIIALLALLLDNLIGSYRYKKMSPVDKLWAEISRNLRVLSLLGFSRREGETLQEFQDRTQKGLLPATVSLTFIEAYEALLYGNRQVNEEGIVSAAEDRQGLQTLLKEKNKWKYYYFVVTGNTIRR